MKSLLSSRLIQSLGLGFGYCVSSVQHLLMKAAVAVSLKLCLFTARILLNASARSQAGPAL